MRVKSFLSIVCAASSLLHARAHAQPAIEQAGVPSWAELVQVPTPEPPEDDGAVVQLLSDTQVHIEPGRVVTLRHSAKLVRAQSGVDEVASLDVERGADDRISWHFIRHMRAGKTKDLLPLAHSRVIQPEADRDRGVLTGRVHELVVLTDIRVGDLVEVAYSVDAPLLRAAPRVTLYEWLGKLTPVQRMAWRASWPSDSKLQFKAAGAAVIQVSDHELRYQREHSPAYPFDENMPSWFNPVPHVELSEYSDWAEVARLEGQFYPETDALSPAWINALSRIDDPQLRMTAAVRMVQDEVRYMGIEDGEQAVIPRAPAEVLRRGYGDCKDKSYLLVTLLRALGFQAAPALVSARWRGRVTERLPSSLPFDHAIVLARLGERELWIDATQRFLHATVDHLPNLPFGYALVLRAGETALREVPVAAHSEPDVTVIEHFDIQEGGRSRLLVKTLYQNEQAIEFREYLARRSRRQLEDSSQELYASQYRGVRIAEPLKIVDAPNEEKVYTEEYYTLDKFWSEGERSVAAWSIMERLPAIASQRRTPLALPFPLHVQHKIELDAREGWDRWRKETNVDTEFFAGTIISQSRTFRLHEVLFDMRTKTESVAPEKLQRYADERQRLFDALQPAFLVGWKNHPDRGQPSQPIPLELLFVALGVGGIAVARRYVLKRRATVHTRKFARAKRQATGEEPRTAIEITKLADAESILKKLRCCGQALCSATPSAASNVSYDGAELKVYRLACTTCGQLHRRYFRVQG